MEKIVLNVPHASINGIFDTYGKWPRNPHFINDCVNKWTDWYVDFLFATTNEKVSSIVFPYSRFVCDVERLENDPLEAEGRGILYHCFGGYSRGNLSKQETDYLYGLRKRHIDALKEMLTPDSVLIDCHSFPEEIHDCDICIGFNNDDTYDERLVLIVKQQFENMHYKVSVNEPYSNSFAPISSFAYKSLMIEVNKHVYMNNCGGLNRNSRQWMRWFGCLNRIYNTILNYE